MENMRYNLIVKMISHFSLSNFINSFLNVTECQSDNDPLVSIHVATKQTVSCVRCFYLFISCNMPVGKEFVL
jgi:hypothetical protein